MVRHHTNIKMDSSSKNLIVTIKTNLKSDFIQPSVSCFTSY